MVRLLDAISTNETWFFRNPKHFSFVKDTLCPAWIAEAKEGRRPRRVTRVERRRVERRGAVLAGDGRFSMGCRAGTSRSWPSDLSSRVLERAQAATLSMEKSGDIPAPYLKRYMLRGSGAQDGKMRAGPELRSVVTFRRFNLNDESGRVESERAVRPRVLPERPHVFRGGTPGARPAPDHQAPPAARLSVPGRRGRPERLPGHSYGRPGHSHPEDQRRASPPNARTTGRGRGDEERPTADRRARGRRLRRRAAAHDAACWCRHAGVHVTTAVGSAGRHGARCAGTGRT